MPEYKTVKINVGKGYDVLIGGGLLSDCGGLIRDAVGKCRAAVITDSNVEKLYLKTVLDSLKTADIDAVSFVFPAGEENKSISVLSDILEFMAENRLGRGDIVIALGGGVTGDMAGLT